jgi:hypothetical protein
MGFSIAEILQAQGDAAAKARQARGTMWGSLAQYAGTIPREIIADRAQERERAQVAQVRQLQIQKGQAEAQQQQDEQGKLEVLRQVYRVAQDPTTGKLDEQRAAAIIAQSRFPELTEFMAKAKQAGLDKELEASVKRSTAAENTAHAKLYEAQATDLARPPGYKLPSNEAMKFGAFTASIGIPGARYEDLTPEQKIAYQKYGDLDPKYGGMESVLVDGKPALIRPGPGGKFYDLKNQEVTGTITKAPTERAPDQVLVPTMGPNGVPIWTPRSSAAGQAVVQPPRAVTGLERQTLSFYNRAKEAIDTITTPPKEGEPSLEDAIAKVNLASQAQLQYAPNILQTQQQQAYRQAQRTFTEARLRKESGAMIRQDEYEGDAKTYFAQPGDDAKTIEQKRKARQTVLDGLKFSAGKAYEEFYGQPNVSPARTGAAKTGDKTTVGRFQIDVEP